MSGNFTLDDFGKQFKQDRKLGPMRQIMTMIPGLEDLMNSNPDVEPEEEMRKIEGIINSMTPDERRDPSLLNRDRYRRIAYGSGVDESDVRKLVREFSTMREKIDEMAGRWKL